MKIGVTEQGDPSLDYSWFKKVDSVDGVVLVTKNLTDKLLDHLLQYKEKIVVHLSCTGYGGTEVEPNVPAPDIQLRQLDKLVDRGFYLSHVVIRVDPIIPTERGLGRAKGVLQSFAKTGYKRFRVSLLDAYPHVRKRFAEAGLYLPYGTGFLPNMQQFNEADKMLHDIKSDFPDIVIESCAEGKLLQAEAVGCISKKDLTILGLPEDEADEAGYQRSGCLCCSAKTELLEHKRQCPYRCLYCYWRAA